MLRSCWSHITKKIKCLAHAALPLVAAIYVICSQSPAFATVQPTPQNPAGLSMTSESWPFTAPTAPTSGLITYNSETGYFINSLNCFTGDVSGGGSTGLVCQWHFGSSGAQSPAIVAFKSTKGSPSDFVGTNLLLNTYLPMIGSECAVADFDGDGRSDLACFENNNYMTDVFTSSAGTTPNISTEGTIFSWSPNNDVARNYPALYLSTGAAFASPVSNPNLIVPTLSWDPNSGTIDQYFNYPMFVSVAGPPGPTPFGNSCTVGHFLAGPGSEIICVPPNNAFLPPPTAQYYLYKFTSSHSVTTEAEYAWTGPAFIPSAGGLANWGPSGCLTGDFNGDGLTDVACPETNHVPLNTHFEYVRGTGSDGNWQVSLSNGTNIIGANGLGINGFQPPKSWASTYVNSSGQLQAVGDYTPSGYNEGVPASNFGGAGNDCAVGDFNGDGKSDIICYAGSSSGAANFSVYLSTGSSFLPAQTWTIPGLDSTISSIWYNYTVNNDPLNALYPGHGVFDAICAVADLNGDGKSDLICPTTTPGQWLYALSSGSSSKSFPADINGVTSVNGVPSKSVGFEVGQISGVTIPTTGMSAYLKQVGISKCFTGNFTGTGSFTVACPTDNVVTDGSGNVTSGYITVGTINRP